MELAVIYPPPIHCYYYIGEEIKGGYKFTYLHKVNDSTLEFTSVSINHNDDAPCFIVDRMPNNWNKKEVVREFLQRT